VVLIRATEYPIWYVTCDWYSSDVGCKEMMKRNGIQGTNYKQLTARFSGKRNNNTI
jgi:hypothetical protein